VLDGVRDMKSNGLRLALLLLLALVCGAFSVWTLTSLVRQRDTHDIVKQLGTAVTQLEKGPQGLDTMEKFIVNLRRIDPGHAPEEVKVALKDYVTAAERDLAELKAGRQPTQVDAEMAQAREKLVEILKKDG
jgi:hypothetical protein